MRTLLLLAILLQTGCAKPVSDAQRANHADAIDKSVLMAALVHFRSLPDLWLPSASAAEGHLLLHRDYETSKGLISASQIKGDISQWTVPEEARLDMERRVDATEELPRSHLPAFIHILDFDERPPYNILEFVDHGSEAKCWVKLWPPGYTRDGRRAVVRFLFGPTSHGASATYLLQQCDGKWHIVHHSVAYYA